MAKNVDPIETRARQDVQPYVNLPFQTSSRVAELLEPLIESCGCSWGRFANFAISVSLVARAKAPNIVDGAVRVTCLRAMTQSKPKRR